MRRFLLAAVMCVTATSGSHAADLSDLPFLRGPVGLTSGRVNWQGFYVGGQGGFGTTDMDFTGATQSVPGMTVLFAFWPGLVGLHLVVP